MVWDKGAVYHGRGSLSAASPSMASSGVKLLSGLGPGALMYSGRHLPAMTTQADEFNIVFPVLM